MGFEASSKETTTVYCPSGAGLDTWTVKMLDAFLFAVTDKFTGLKVAAIAELPLEPPAHVNTRNCEVTLASIWRYRLTVRFVVSPTVRLRGRFVTPLP